MTASISAAEPSARDRLVIQYVAKFKQLSAFHISSLVFHELTTRTPTYRSLNRLVSQNYLHRIERRIVGGAKGGSGQYVYSLGRRGFYMHFTGRYDPARNVRFHDLAIADAFVLIKQVERAGLITINGVSTEPDCWTTIGGTQLKPDMYVDVTKRSGERLRLWLEVDMGTEAQRQLKGQLEAYWRAYNDADVTTMPVFPKIVWIGVDAERVKELTWLIETGPRETQALFEVYGMSNLANLFIS